MVGRLEGIENADRSVADRQQSVVRNHDEGVDLVAQLVDTGVGLLRAATSFEPEGSGDHTDRQRADGAGDLSDDRCATGSGSAAFAGRDEDHVGTLEHLFDLGAVVFSSAAADLWVSTGAEAAGELTTDVELDVGVAHQQCLRVGVDGDELDPFEADLDHPVDGVDATTTDAHHLDDR